MEQLVTVDRATVLEIARMDVRHYAGFHPRPSQVTQDQAAEMVGVSAATISRMVKAGALTSRLCREGVAPIMRG